jgi:hypothetical protein
MFRCISCGSGAVEEYFFVEQDLEINPVASKRHLDCTITELLQTTYPIAECGVTVCRVKTIVAVCQ